MRTFISIYVMTVFSLSAFAAGNPKSFFCLADDARTRLAEFTLTPMKTEVYLESCSSGIEDVSPDCCEEEPIGYCEANKYTPAFISAKIADLGEFKTDIETKYGFSSPHSPTKTQIIGKKVLKNGSVSYAVRMTIKYINNKYKSSSFSLREINGGPNSMERHECLIDTKPNEVEAVYKILTKSQLEQFNEDGYFEGNASDIKDGFFHLAARHQLDRVIAKYYADKKPVYLKKFKKPEFLKYLVWEPASNGDLYPHLYQPRLLLSDAVFSYEERVD